MYHLVQSYHGKEPVSMKYRIIQGSGTSAGQRVSNEVSDKRYTDKCPTPIQPAQTVDQTVKCQSTPMFALIDCHPVILQMKVCNIVYQYDPQ